MIMNVCVLCVFIVTTKCKAMRNIHLEEQDDQETSYLFYYIFLYYSLYILHAKHQQYKRNYDDEKKPLHSVKYDTKNFKKKYWSGDNVLFNKKSKIYFVLLYEIFSNKTTFYFLA